MSQSVGHEDDLWIGHQQVSGSPAAKQKQENVLSAQNNVRIFSISNKKRISSPVQASHQILHPIRIKLNRSFALFLPLE